MSIKNNQIFNGIRIALASLLVCLFQGKAQADLSISSDLIATDTTIEIINTDVDIQSVIDSIPDASSTKPYLIALGAGVFDLGSARITMAEFVSIRGSGPGVTVLTSSTTAATPSNTAATVDLADHSSLSDLTVENTGTGTYGMALYSALTTRNAVVDNVIAEANGNGGTGHFAAYWNDAEAVIRNSTLFARGANTAVSVNAAFASVNIAAGFPQALIENSILLGGAASNKENCNDNAGSGFGMQLSSSSPLVRGSYICGGHRGIFSATGHPQIQNSNIKVSSTVGAFMLEITAGSLKIANSGVGYVANKLTGGGGNGLSCVHTYDLGTYAPKLDAVNSALACN